jgi:membrane protease YdiL (CAAX protease family)
MLNKLRRNPLAAALLIFIIYAGFFFLPLLFGGPDPDKHGIVGVEGAIDQWKKQVFLVSFLTVAVGMLGWWKKIGFTPLNRGGLKFLLPPILYIGLMLAVTMDISHHTTWLLGAADPLQMAILVLVVLGIGYNEETMFRGILFYGFSSRFSILAAVILSSLVFGVLHYVNLIEGATFEKTTYQVLHAAAAGFMYIALRLRIGAIWPVMLFHALWDFCVFNIDAMRTGMEAGSSISPAATTAIEILPATLYGAFVYWRWVAYRNKNEQNQTLTLSSGIT